MTDKRTLLGLSLVAVLAFVLGGYYFVHKPITLAQAMALVGSLANLGVAFWLTSLGGAIGRRLLRDADGMIAGEALTVQAALGWGVMGLVMLALGLARLYYPAVIWAMTLVVSLIVWRDARGWLGDARQTVRGLWSSSRNPQLAIPNSQFAILNPQLAILFISLALALGLLRALAPPLMWDALVYHLALPKLYAQTHQLRLDAEFFFAGMPQLNEMLYTAAILLRGGIAAQVLGWMFGGVLALGLAAHAAALFGERFGALAPAILLASFSISLSLAWAYGELLLMLMALAMLIGLRQWRSTGAARWLILSGLFSGFALACKYTGVIAPLGGLIVVLVLRPRSSTQLPNHLTSRLLLALYFLLSAFSVFAPWLLKNWLFTGNPVYPVWFPARAVDALRLWFYNRPDLAQRNPLWAALIFFRAVFLGVQGGNDYDATLTPLIVFLPLALALGWRRLEATVRRDLWPVALFALAANVIWAALALTSSLALQTRLFFTLMPALTLLSIGGLAALEALDPPRLRVSFIVNAALALVFGLSAFEIGADFMRHDPLPYLLGQQSAQDYRAANLGWYAAAIEKVNALPAGARVMFLWEARSLECVSPERCDPDVVIDRWWLLRRTPGWETAEAAVSGWRAEGVTHVLLYITGADFIRAQSANGFTEADWAELARLRNQLRLVEDFGGAYALYALP